MDNIKYEGTADLFAQFNDPAFNSSQNSSDLSMPDTSNEFEQSGADTKEELVEKVTEPVLEEIKQDVALDIIDPDSTLDNSPLMPSDKDNVLNPEQKDVSEAPAILSESAAEDISDNTSAADSMNDISAEADSVKQDVNIGSSVNYDLSDLDVLIGAFANTVKNSVTSISKPNASKYADSLKKILHTEEIKSDILPKAVNLNSDSLQNSSAGAQLTLNDDPKLVDDIFEYISTIRSKADDLINKGAKSNVSEKSPLSDIEGISAIVSDINQINREQNDNGPSKDVLAAISKLPSFDENGNIVENDSAGSNSEFALKDQVEELSADELLAVAQQAAVSQLEQDKALNEKLLEESRVLNANADLKAIVSSQENDEKSAHLRIDDEAPFAESIDDLLVPSLPDTDETVSEFNDAVSSDSESCKNIADENSVELTPLAVAVSVETEKSSSVSEKNATISSDYSDALKFAVSSSLSGKLGANKNAAVNVEAGSENTSGADAPVNIENSSASYSEHVSESSQVESDRIMNDGASVPLGAEILVKDNSHAVNVHVQSADHSSKHTVENGSAMMAQDGNPKSLRESTLKLLEEDQQFENRSLGRKLETNDFYTKVLESSQWLRCIRDAGYTDGPMYSALCYANRTISPANEYDWTLEISSDFEFLTSAPEFVHNLQTKFSILMQHPVVLNVKTVKGIPFECPEDLARKWYLKELENARIRIRDNVVLNRLLTSLGENANTINLSLYTQEDSKQH